MASVLERLKNEPVLITGLVQAVLLLLLAFGISVSDEQIGAIMAVVAVLLALGARLLVTPNGRVPELGVVPAEPPMYPDVPGE